MSSVLNRQRAARGAVDAFTVGKSCRFNDVDSPYLTRTPGGAGDKKTWTFSTWLKRTSTSTSLAQLLFMAGVAGDRTFLGFDTSDCATIGVQVSDTFTTWRTTTAIFRDFHAWYHFVFVVDTTVPTVKIYVNGVEITAFSTSNDPSADQLTDVNDTDAHYLSSYIGALNYFDGYLAETHLIDGAARVATDFGEFDENGVWVPIEYSGAYGTNGFHFNYAVAPGTGNGAGTDVSGTGSHYTDSGVAANDQMLDTPVDNTDNNTGNYCTWGVDTGNCGYHTQRAVLSNGNLDCKDTANSGGKFASGTIAARKFYCELTLLSHDPAVSSQLNYGFAAEWHYYDASWGYIVALYGQLAQDGRHWDSGISGSGYQTVTASDPAWEVDDVMAIAFDADAGEVSYFKNGSALGSTITLSGGAWPTGVLATPTIRVNGTDSSWSLNCGQKGFAHTPPAGFGKLCTTDLPAPTIPDPSAHFQTTLYTGNGTVIGSGGKVVNQSGTSTFEPDLVWIKNRDELDQNILTDSVRGATKYLSSDDTDIEVTAAETLSTFDSDGFTVGNDVQVNTNTEDYLAWQWLEGATPGFDVVTYSGTGSELTVSHSLGQNPDYIMIKNRDATDSWRIAHEYLTSMANNYLNMDLFNASQTDTGWLTVGSSSIILQAASDEYNASGEDYVAYLWASVPGFSKFGYYIGNGLTTGSGPFVYTGFKPAYVMVKNIEAASGWLVWDQVQSPSTTGSPYTSYLVPSHTAVEGLSVAAKVDFFSNGFVMRNEATSGTSNPSSERVVYVAFAAHPFGGSGVSQCKAG